MWSPLVFWSNWHDSFSTMWNPLFFWSVVKSRHHQMWGRHHWKVTHLSWWIICIFKAWSEPCVKPPHKGNMNCWISSAWTPIFLVLPTMSGYRANVQRIVLCGMETRGVCTGFSKDPMDLDSTSRYRGLQGAESPCSKQKIPPWKLHPVYQYDIHSENFAS